MISNENVEKSCSVLAENLIKESVKHAVFTFEQKEEIVRIDCLFNAIIIDKLNDLENRLQNPKNREEIRELENKLNSIKASIFDNEKMEEKIERLERDVNHLLEYSEYNTEIVSQIKREVEQLDSEMNLLETRSKKFEDKVSKEIYIQARDIDRLELVDEGLKSEINDLQCQIDKIKEEVYRVAKREIKDERVDTIVSTINRLATKEEMKDILYDITLLKKREMRDERVDTIIRRIVALENKDYRDERIESIIKRVSTLESKEDRVTGILSLMTSLATKKELEEIGCKVDYLTQKSFIDERVTGVLKRLRHLEEKELKDERVDALITLLSSLATKNELDEMRSLIGNCGNSSYLDSKFDEISRKVNSIELKSNNNQVYSLNSRLDEISKINAIQSKKIDELILQNNYQSNEIRQLTEKLNRNSMLLDTKINELERRETKENRVEYDQNATLKFLQSEVMRLTQEFNRLEREKLLKPVC